MLPSPALSGAQAVESQDSCIAQVGGLVRKTIYFSLLSSNDPCFFKPSGVRGELPGRLRGRPGHLGAVLRGRGPLGGGRLVRPPLPLRRRLRRGSALRQLRPRPGPGRDDLGRRAGGARAVRRGTRGAGGARHVQGDADAVRGGLERR